MKLKQEKHEVNKRTCRFINHRFFLMSIILENYYKLALDMLQKEDLLSLATPILIESESYEKERDTSYRILNGACTLFASISSVNIDLENTGTSNDALTIQSYREKKFKEIAQHIVSQTGLIRQLCLNLGSLRDGPVIKNIIRTIGNLANLPEVQKNEFLLKRGLESIIGYMLGQGLSKNEKILKQI